jgi:minor histocompatibility antigen H13
LNLSGAPQFLFAAVREAGDTRYPFSVLGLGDVVVPGAFVSLLRQVDIDGLEADTGGAKPAAKTSEVDFVYFYAGVGAYAAGLAATFVANYVTKAGQPALVYIVPSLLLTAVATAASRGELPQLLAYKSQRAEAAKVKREHEMKAEWKAKKEEAQAGKE